MVLIDRFASHSLTISERKYSQLEKYLYSICYKQGKLIGNANALSRLPKSIKTSSDCVPGDFVHLVMHLSTTTIDANRIKAWTDKDPLLSKVR